MGFALVHGGCGESFEGVDPSRIHPMRSTLVQMGCGESLKGLDRSRIQRMGSIQDHRGCGESLKGIDPSRMQGCMGHTVVHGGWSESWRVWTVPRFKA